MSKAAEADLAKALQIADKHDRENRLDEIKADTIAALEGQFPDRLAEVSAAIRSVTKKTVRQRILKDGVRIDGRGLADIRPVSAEVAVIPRVHGSALFEVSAVQRCFGEVADAPQHRGDQGEQRGHRASPAHPGADPRTA